MSAHKIEEAVRVYLVTNAEGTAWVADQTNFSMGLFSDYEDGPLHEDCDCEDEAAGEAARSAAESLPLPDGEGLLRLLADALGYVVTPREV